MSTEPIAGADIGGTFTDIVVLHDGRLSVDKVLNDPADLAGTVINGLAGPLAQLGASATDVGALLHATTVATNALLERRGTTVGLITNEGFEDLLEIGRQRSPDPFDPHARRPAPLVDRGLVAGVRGRLSATGEVLTPLDEDGVLRAYEQLIARGVGAIAVCLLHSHVNPAHELAVLDLASRVSGHRPPLFLSHQISPEAREYERTSTTSIAAYLSEAVGTYVGELATRVRQFGGSAPLWVMKSNGGIVPSRMAVDHPHQLVESGPAAGVVGAACWARELGIDDLMTFDMGGTTAKAALIIGGQPGMNHNFEVGGAAHAGDFLVKDTGYPLRTPVVDLAEVGTGGGSIAWLDDAAALRVGPRSAGADPGPACYGRGGSDPTVTDADMVLGYLGNFDGSCMLDLDLESARVAITRLAGDLGLTVEATGEGIVSLAAAQMADAVRLVSVSRGQDPRRLPLMAFGGAGPVHAWAVARILGIERLLIPPAPGVASAIGLLTAKYAIEQTRGVLLRGDSEQDCGELRSVASELERSCTELQRAGAGSGGPAPDTRYQLAMRYRGQSYEIDVTLADVDAINPVSLMSEFAREHERVYGFAGQRRPLEVTVVRVTQNRPVVQYVAAGIPRERVPTQTVPAWFDGRWWDCQAIDRMDVGDRPIEGPLLVRQPDTTTVVPPGARAVADAAGYLTIEGLA